MLLELLYNPLYSVHMWLAGVLGIDQDIVEVYYHKDIKFFDKNLIDVSLEASWSFR